MQLANEPKVALHVEIANGAICSSRLSLSDAFICTGADNEVMDWLRLYLLGKTKALPLSFENLSLFQREALEALLKIPFGNTRSYGEIAAKCGQPKAARAIGNACHRNPFPLLIPCHRVIQSNGKLGGFALDLEIKRRLLEFEASRTLAS